MQKHHISCVFCHVYWHIGYMTPISHRPLAFASPGWASYLSWCRHSSPLRQRKTTCSGGLSLCGTLPEASAGRRRAPWPCGQFGLLSRSTCQTAGSTWHSPWCVCVCVCVQTGLETDYTGVNSLHTPTGATHSHYFISFTNRFCNTDTNTHLLLMQQK